MICTSFPVLLEWGKLVLGDLEKKVLQLFPSYRKLIRKVGSLEAQLKEAREEVNSLEAQLKEAIEDSHKDGLTGLYNKRAFDEDLAGVNSLYNRGNIEGFYIVTFDLDKFKEVNDKYGHGKGNEVLKFIKEINKEIREKIYRIGGEEFGIILPNSNECEVVEVVNKIQNRLKEKEFYDENGKEFNVTASFGIGNIKGKPLSTKNYGKIVEEEKSDKALYESKERGRNRFTIEQNGEYRTFRNLEEYNEYREKD